jgi:hypothetical protein
MICSIPELPDPIAHGPGTIHLDHRLLGVAPGTVGVLSWWKVGFKDRFQHQHRCCHADLITQGRDDERNT